MTHESTTLFDSNDTERVNKIVHDLLVTSPEGVIIVFEKKDGTTRQMRATLNSELIPQSDQETSTSKKKENPNIQVVYDMDKEGWRSYRKEFLVSYVHPLDSFSSTSSSKPTTTVEA